MEQSKKYYAFISYKREDKKEANWLQHALEYYRLPNYLRQDNPELTKYVCLVFRDMTDLEVDEQPALTMMCELVTNHIGGIMGTGTSIYSFENRLYFKMRLEGIRRHQ